MTIIETNQVNIPNDPKVLKAIKDAMQEASNSYLRIEGERDFLKKLFADLAEGTELPKAYLVKTAKIFHKNNVSAVSTDQENVIELYESVFGPINPKKEE
jgi:hypothetical protein